MRIGHADRPRSLGPSPIGFRGSELESPEGPVPPRSQSRSAPRAVLLSLVLVALARLHLQDGLAPQAADERKDQPPPAAARARRPAPVAARPPLKERAPVDWSAIALPPLLDVSAPYWQQPQAPEPAGGVEPPSPPPPPPPPPPEPAHMGKGELEHARELSGFTRTPIEDIMALRESGLGWGEVAHQLGLNLGAAVGARPNPPSPPQPPGVGGSNKPPSPPGKPPPPSPPGHGPKKPRP